MAQLLTVGLAGCTTTLTHQKLDVGAQPTSPGFSYYLPRQRYSVTATYELKSCPDTMGGEDAAKRPLEITQTVTVVESSVIDPSEYYSIPLSSLTSGWKTTSLTGTLYDNQTLHTFGASVDDRTGAIVKGILGTGLSLARIIVGAPLAAASEVPASRLCKPEIYTALDVLQATRAKLLDSTLDEKVRANLIAVSTAVRASLQITETYVFDPAPGKLELTGAPNRQKLLGWFTDPDNIGSTNQVVKERYERAIATGVHIRGQPSTVELPAGTLRGKGVIYREPVDVLVEVCAGPCKVSSPEILATMPSQAAQFGRHVVVPLENSAFQKNNLSLSFAANGRLESFTYGSESSLEKMAATASESATSIESVIAKKQAAEDAAEKAAAGAELTGLKAEIELLKAKADKIEAEARLNGLTGGQ